MKNKLGLFAVIVCFVGLIISWVEGNISNMILNGLLIVTNLIIWDK